MRAKAPHKPLPLGRVMAVGFTLILSLLLGLTWNEVRSAQSQLTDLRRLESPELSLGRGVTVGYLDERFKGLDERLRAIDEQIALNGTLLGRIESRVTALQHQGGARRDR